MLLLTVLTCFTTIALCRRLHPRLLEARQDTNASDYDGPMVPEHTILIPVDHFNKSDTRTYSNRYWVNDTYYQPGGPVFFFDRGEAGVSEFEAAVSLAEINGTISAMALARQYNGLAILWEHRYYGESLPVAMNKSIYDADTGFDPTEVQPLAGPEGWSYLTVDQALEDATYFAKNFQAGSYQRVNMSALAPTNAPWIWIGGSYPGDRAAFARIRSPEVWYASWASSAVPQAIVDGSTYFAEAERTLPKNCSNDMRAMIAYVDKTLSGDPSNQTYLDIQRYMYVASAVGFSYYTGIDYDISFAEYWDGSQIGQFMAWPFYGYYQTYGPVPTTRVFCDFFQTYHPGVEGTNTSDQYINAITNTGDAQPSSDGLLATYNNSTIVFQAFARALGLYQNYTTTVATNLISTDYQYTKYIALDGVSWLIQVETELGWFQGSNPTNITYLSEFYNYTYLGENLQKGYFNQDTIDWLPREPNITAFNTYGGWNMNPSNVMFTAGEHDPWRAGGVFSRESGSPGYQPTTQVPACGVAPAEGTRYGTIYSGASHVWDLYYESIYTELASDAQGRDPQQQGLALFTAALDTWLPCFKTSAGNTTATNSSTSQASATSISMRTVVVVVFSLVTFIMTM